MKFLINPECYHRMCQSCADRLFSHGPGPCPIHGCNRTLRRNKFREQRFEDIKIEREVDVRRRIAEACSRSEDEFETLSDYNNYLEEVETITFNLLNKIDVEKSEAKLRAYAAQKAPSAEQSSTKLEPLSNFESSNTLISSTSESRAGLNLKRSSARNDRMKPTTSVTPQEQQMYSLKGLRALPLKSVVKSEAYSPFGGLSSALPVYAQAKNTYSHPWLEKARTDTLITAGGYVVQEYCKRSIFEAFAGLGVFVEDEVESRPANIQGGMMGLTLDDDIKMVGA
jgi:CDK-activating kinase assembly factor MAT1